MSTEAERLRTLKAQETRRLGPDHPSVVLLGRKLDLIRLIRWADEVRLHTWTEREFAIVIKVIERARNRGRAESVTQGVTQRRPENLPGPGDRDPYAPKRVTQVRARKHDLFRRIRDHVF